MSENKNIDSHIEKDQVEVDSNLAVSHCDVASITSRSSIKNTKLSTTEERQIKFERAQRCLENAALVSKRIKEHRKATAELLGRPFEDDNTDNQSELASAMSEKTGYSVATDTSTTLSVQDALNIPGISESLANTLKQKEILMERIKQYKEISKRPMKTSPLMKKGDESAELRKSSDNNEVLKLKNIIKDKDNTLSIIQVKMKAMETTIIDLQEKNNEKDQIIEAKNKANTIISDSLTKKEKDTLDLLEDTKDQMCKMQQNFIAIESEWKEEKLKLLAEIEEKDAKLKSLNEANTILENSRFEISLAHSKLTEELDIKTLEISKLQEKINELTKTYEKDDKPEQQIEEEKGVKEISNMAELTKKIECLEQLNYQIRQTNKELEIQLSSVSKDCKSSTSITTTTSPIKKGSPLPSRKGRNTASKMKSPWSKVSAEALNQEPEKKPLKTETTKSEMLLQALNKDILDKEYLISQKDAVITELQSNIKQKETKIDELKFQISLQNQNVVDKVDIGLCTDLTTETNEHLLQITESKNFESQDVKDLEEKFKSALNQINLLNDEIDTANKNMIKVKSNSKLKLKQMQKTIDNFSKVSDANAEIVHLNEEIHQLSQKVAELEEEKGNLQLHLVDYDSGRLTDTEVYKKMVEMENLAEARLKSISLLETQKFDLVQELHNLQQKNAEMEDKLADITQLQNEQVCTEIKSVQLEEQIDELTAAKKELELVIENLKLDKEQVRGNIDILQNEKEELIQKLENYVQENMELNDKLEKLSAEKVSSAESIEIVESLTTQEKLEIEEYNKGIESEKAEKNNSDNSTSTPPENTTIAKVLQENAELKNKIELFTQERQEVMEKMNKICFENNMIHKDIEELQNQCHVLQRSIDLLTNEKLGLMNLNKELHSQIEELKHERVEIVKENANIKPIAVEDSVDSPLTEVQQDDKGVMDKGAKGAKSIKQLTKEILKLKNVLKEREDEIADCQMKILSLEEQQQKQPNLIQSNLAFELKIKQLSEENNCLKVKNDVIESLQQELQQMQREYNAAVNSRDTKIQELEHHLIEYEKQVFSYSNTLQQKDKDINEYVNQVTKLNDILQKLKSRIENLEEEKAKDQNAELVKSLNKQIALYQNALADCEDKLRALEDDKAQLSSLKSKQENKSVILETELTKLKETFNENQKIIEELRRQQNKQKEEYSEILIQLKERDEEIHEIKLQLRKESIENEKLRTMLQQKEQEFVEATKEYEELKNKFDSVNLDQSTQFDQCTVLENKNKELTEKLKKFALSIRKKSAMYSELENQIHDIQKQLESKSEQYAQALIQVETIPALQEKVKHANEELSRILTEKNILEGKYKDSQLELLTLQQKYDEVQEEFLKLNDTMNLLNKDIYYAREENVKLQSSITSLNNKLVEYEIEQKNNANLLTKISCLEVELNQKQMEIQNLTTEIQNKEQGLKQLEFGHDAKVQERDMYIENLQVEIDKYKNRICRLEESISVMENRRQSLERKADQLDNQLQEKQKSYSEYTTQEDELVGRLAVLMDHDRVLEKQVQEIENDNKELQCKLQNLNEDFVKLQKSHSDLQQYCITLENKSAKVETLEAENSAYQSKVDSLEINLRKLNNEYQLILSQRKSEIDDLESEFNTQIEEAIKEKKSLSEKYEKLNEHVVKLEYEIQEYKAAIENLHSNLEELSKQNRQLVEKSNVESSVTPDYTEQYISEINRLNAVINSKNYQINEEQGKLQTLQAYNNTFDDKNNELTTKLTHSLQRLKILTEENEKLNSMNNELNNMLSQKEDQIKQVLEKKKLVFEMNIPKTEGMTISSTIEELSDEQKSLSALQSQILSEAEISNEEKETVVKRDLQTVENSLYFNKNREGSIEPLIVSKKAYICSNEGDEEGKDLDPFNSDEGWGLGESVEVYDVTPGITQLNQEIQSLKEKNDTLKKDLDSSNSKLLKAVKKLKELKNANDMLANELKISKQIANSSMLDMAIESELSNNLEILDKKVQELTDSLNKEKKDKEMVSKQNEVLKNANERLIEMKEKTDNELELWKYNFKQVNDKISSNQQLKCESQHMSQLNSDETVSKKSDSQLEEEISKLEKENDELQDLVDSLTNKNRKLSDEVHKLNYEISHLNENFLALNEFDSMKSQLFELNKTNNDLNTNREKMQEDLYNLEQRCSELQDRNEKLKEFCESQKTLYETKERELVDHNSILLSEVQTLKCNLENADSQLQQEKQNSIELSRINTLSEQYEAVKEDCETLKCQLENANKTINDLELENKSLLQKHHDQINELESKLQNLNLENDQLLSTVAELRSSVSSAMDQRGFEIAELWKQHLAQRETEFQSIERDLRTQLSVFESKYEQLLDSVQSSTQEDTNKILILEQITSLQNKLQEKEEQLNTLQDKFADVIHQLDMLRSEMEDEKLIQDNKILVQQEEYEKVIKDLRSEVQRISTDRDSNATLQTELIATKSVNDSLNERLSQIEINSKALESKISDLTKEIQQKDIELFQKTHDYTIMLADRNNEFEMVRKQLVEYEKKVEDLTFEKESELAVLRLKMHESSEHQQKIFNELEEEKIKLSEALKEKIIECTNLNKQINDLNKVLEEYANKSVETQLVLESQELEIVTLKDELESMKTAMRAASSKITKHVTFASDAKASSSNVTENVLNRELLDAVPKAELDLALYMLHQRDVRCEELTMELTQLLEERDTLQLRLSDSLRSFEELKSRYGSIDVDTSTSSNQDTISELPSFSIERESQFVDTHRAQVSRSSSISEPDGDKPKLQAKLSELRSVKHSRDVRLRQESEQRQLGMRLLQRDVANLPPEAVEQLSQAHHTLSRDSQSTPTVLLNWLRGKSTPKVVHM